MHPAVNSLVAPSQKRAGVKMGGILQIMVGRGCDEACHGCTQGSNLRGKTSWMSVEHFDEACASLEGYHGITGLFGGNCCLHPRFDELCRILRARFPFKQRGIWTNCLRGKGTHARITFDPSHSNLNVHMSKEAADEIRKDWPEAARFIKGEHQDSVHGTPWKSMKDLGIPEEERWERIADCDISRHWSSIIIVIRGRPMGFFCEVAGAMASLHEDNPDWEGSGRPMENIGIPITPGWWRKPMAAFEQQVLTCCHNCAVPLRLPGQMALGDSAEEFSYTHRHIARPKTKDHPIEIIESIGMVQPSNRPSTEYLDGITPGYKAKVCP